MAEAPAPGAGGAAPAALAAEMYAAAAAVLGQSAEFALIAWDRLTPGGPVRRRWLAAAELAIERLAPQWAALAAERDDVRERAQFMESQRDMWREASHQREAERDRLADRVEEVTGRLREVAAERDRLAGELAEVRALIGAHQPALASELLAERAAGKRLATQLAKRDKAFEALDRITASQARSMYAAWIDAQRGYHASGILHEALDGFDAPPWDGTETGLQWLERTRAALGGGPDGR